jgi:aflatoxin B1 aldehyde reductase
MAPATPSPAIVFGAASFSEGSSHPTATAVEEVLQALNQEGITTIDTAQIYGTSEQLLGETKAASRFVVDTKHCGGFAAGQSTKDKVIAGAEESLKRLQTDKVVQKQSYSTWETSGSITNDSFL